MLSPSPFGRIATQQHHTISVLSLARGRLAPFFLSYILYLLTCTILHHHTIDDDITTLHTKGPGETTSTIRRAFEILHRVGAMAMVGIAVATVVLGSQRMGFHGTSTEVVNRTVTAMVRTGDAIYRNSPSHVICWGQKYLAPYRQTLQYPALSSLGVNVCTVVYVSMVC